MSWPQWWCDRDWRAGVLSPLGRLVCSLASRRRRRFEHAFTPALPTAVVVVVGNVTVGGSGKTPLIMRLGEALAQRGIDYGIVSRGYGGRAPRYPMRVSEDCDPAISGDEPCLLARRLNVPVVVAPRRMEAVEVLLEAHPNVRVILSDDGLQHFAMPRDIEVVVADGRRGFGNGLCMPAGPLREPQQVAERVDFRICNGEPGDSWLAGWPVMRLVPEAWINGRGEHRPVDAFAGMRVNALAGIGNPKRFFDQLAALGVELDRMVSLPDHASAEAILRRVNGGGLWLMTEKDAIKCPGRENVWALSVRAEVPEAWLGRWLDAVEKRIKVKYES